MFYSRKKKKRGTIDLIEMCFLVMVMMGKLNMKVKKALWDYFQPLPSQFILMSGIIPSQVQNPAFVVEVHAVHDAQELLSSN